MTTSATTILKKKLKINGVKVILALAQKREKYILCDSFRIKLKDNTTISIIKYTNLFNVTDPDKCYTYLLETGIQIIGYTDSYYHASYLIQIAPTMTYQEFYNHCRIQPL